MDKPFCVIGRSCGKFGGMHQRKWFATEDEAISHAGTLVSRSHSDRRIAFVVEVKQVVTTAPPTPPVFVTPQKEFKFDPESA